MLPVMVVQVADKPTAAHLGEIVAIIESEWGHLDQHAVVNVFGEHSDLVIGARNARYVNPETIQDNDGIRVFTPRSSTPRARIPPAG